jgi:hypothetical protein
MSSTKQASASAEMVLAGDDVRALVKVLLERFEITQVDLARETGLPNRQSIGLWLRGDKLAQEAVISAGKAVATWCSRFKHHGKGEPRPLPAKVRRTAENACSRTAVSLRLNLYKQRVRG